MGLAPSRVDWRWAKAAVAAEYTASQAPYHLGKDPGVLAAYRFKRAVDHGLPYEGPEVVADAYELFSSRPYEKLYVEGMLLGGEANDELIAHKIGATADVVAVYHDIFFDIRSRRDSEGWIVAQLFQGSLYGGMSSRDRVGMLHRVAWLGGSALFSSYYSGKHDPELRGIMLERMRDMLAKNSMLTSMCLGAGGGEQNLAVLQTCLEDTRQTIAAAAGAGSGDKEFGGAILDFLRSVPLQVADPTDTANLDMSAREPRAHLSLAEALKHVPEPNVR